MIKTKRLTIRRVNSGDWKAIQKIWQDQANGEYAQYDKPNDLADEAVSERIKMWASFAETTGHIFMAVCLNNELIGYISLNQSEAAHEIGYCFHSSFHGNGYAKESIEGVIQYLRDIGVERLIAGTALKNMPSVNLLEALGFKQIGCEKVTFYKDSNGRDIFFDGGIYELYL